MDPPDVYEEEVGVRGGEKREVCEEDEGGEEEEDYGDMKKSDPQFLTKTGKKFLHSPPVCGILVNGLLQKQGRSKEATCLF